MTSIGPTLTLLALALVAACSTAQPPPPAVVRPEPRIGCALGVPGSRVVAEDTPEGIALSFTSTDQPAEMRERANDAAAQHGPGEGLGKGHDGRHGTGGEHGLQMVHAPSARSVAEDIENGSRIRFVPTSAIEVDHLRAQLRERAGAMNALACR